MNTLHVDSVSGRPIRPSVLKIVALGQGSLWIQCLVALIAFPWVFLCVASVGYLPVGAYERPFLTWALIQDPSRLTLSVVLCLLPLANRRQARWNELDLGRHARLFIMSAAAILVWPFSTLDYNFFFDQGYIFDRVVLIGLWSLIYVHPLFVVPMFLVLNMLIFQLNVPLPDARWHWPDKRMPFDFLVMLCTFLLMRPFFRRHRQAFILLTLTVVASHYFHAGLNKLLLGPHLWTWASENHLSHIFVGAYVNGGWLRPLSEGTIHRLANALSVIDPLTTTVTLIIECGAILLLLHRKLLPWILAAAIVLHAGILSLTGIFFWKWILFDLILAFWLRQSWRPDDFAGTGQAAVSEASTATNGVRRWLLGTGLFSAHVFVLFVILVVLSKRSFNNIDFDWWDTPYINFFEIRGVGDSGKEYVLDSRFFSPYDIVIHQAQFYYLKERGMIGGTFGVSPNYEFARAVESATPENMDAIRREFGTNHDPMAVPVHRLRLFITQYTNNATRHGRKRWALSWLTPPYHFQTWRPENAYNVQEPLREVYVQHREFLDWRGKLHDVGSERVLEIRLR